MPHVALFHINCNGAKGQPAPEDVRNFDQLLGDVDGMAVLWSEQRAEDLPPGKLLMMKFYTAKSRDGAATEDKIFFDGEHMILSGGVISFAKSIAKHQLAVPPQQTKS